MQKLDPRCSDVWVSCVNISEANSHLDKCRLLVFLNTSEACLHLVCQYRGSRSVGELKTTCKFVLQNLCKFLIRTQSSSRLSWWEFCKSEAGPGLYLGIRIACLDTLGHIALGLAWKHWPALHLCTRMWLHSEWLSYIPGEADFVD